MGDRRLVTNQAELDQRLETPSKALTEWMARCEGDILILGVAGKMGPSLARRTQNAIRAAGVNTKVIGASRFSDASIRAQLEAQGIDTIAVDLLEEKQLAKLPDAPNVIYMAGHKFGTTGREPYTWAMNTYLPGRIAEKYRHSRIVAFSSGNVYPMSLVSLGGSKETDDPGPIGEYAQSCLGRERILQYCCLAHETPMVLLRLNYAMDLRYGVLHDVATLVFEEKPVDVTMGYVNVIWQGDANDIAVRSLEACSVPARIINLTGPEMVSIRWLAEQFGQRFGRPPIIVGEERQTALLNNAEKCHRQFGLPEVRLQELIDWTVAWVLHGGSSLNKPTHFQEVQGRF